MGLIKKILERRKTDRVATLYSDHLSVELAEDFHFHLRNLRIEMDDQEFLQVCRTLLKAYRHWRILGSPKIGDFESVGQQIFLEKSKICAEAGKSNNVVNSDEIRIELQKWTDYVHLHWKWLRLEFSVKEFLEFADAVRKAEQELLQDGDLPGMPRRTGTHHVACPKGRVDREGDGTFWVHGKEDDHLQHPHKTLFLSGKDKNANEHRESVINTSANVLRPGFFTLFVVKVIKRFPAIGSVFGIRIS